MAVSIFKRPLNKEVEQIKSDIGIVENGTTATHNISSGQYVIWQGNLCTALYAILPGDTLSSSNMIAVSNGGLNALNEKFTVESVGTIQTGTIACFRYGRIVVCTIRYDYTSNATLVTGLPKSKHLARSTIVSPTINSAGVVQINEGETTLAYIHQTGSNAAKYGQIVYITDT